jgi:hypothetical protein
MGTIPPAYVRVAWRAGTRQPYSYSIPIAHIDCSKIPAQYSERLKDGGKGEGWHVWT